MIWCPDNQINASFIDISRIKWLVFLLWSSFFRTTSTVASSEAPADYQPRARSNRRYSGEASKTMDYKTVFINLCLELPQNLVVDKGIRQKIHSLIPFRSLIPWRQCLLSGGTEACSLGLRETPGVYTRHPNVCHSHEWRVDTGFRPNSQKNRMRVYTLSDMRSEKKIACIHGLRSEGVKAFTVHVCSIIMVISKDIWSVWSWNY